MKAVYFQLVCGASGDMILSSLLDLGVPLEYLSTEFSRLRIDGLEVKAERVTRAGIDCSHIAVRCAQQKAYRHLSQILEIVRRGGYANEVVERCERVLNRLAEAEAKVHGIPVEKVHFHEIGAVDTIVDVVGAGLCLQYLGVEAVLFSELTVGHGTIKTDHGVMPVPAPATLAMIQSLAVKPLAIEEEILTPTGAAILTSLGRQAEFMPRGRLLKIGYGSGDKVFDGRPNSLRAVLCELEGETTAGQHDRVLVIESDMDHISGEVMAFAAEELLSRGALDVSWSPILMKKGRPGYRLCVICRPCDVEAMADCIIANTRSLGVRYRDMDRVIASRSADTLRLGGDSIEAKRCGHKGISFVKPEYESLARLARERNIPLIDVLEQYQGRKG